MTALFKDQVIRVLLWVIGTIVTASGAGVTHLIVTQEKYQNDVRDVKSDHKIMQMQMYYITRQDSLQDIKISLHEQRLNLIESSLLIKPSKHNMNHEN